MPAVKLCEYPLNVKGSTIVYEDDMLTLQDKEHLNDSIIGKYTLL